VINCVSCVGESPAKLLSQHDFVFCDQYPHSAHSLLFTLNSSPLTLNCT
jgi:hypothetical protein